MKTKLAEIAWMCAKTFAATVTTALSGLTVYFVWWGFTTVWELSVESEVNRRERHQLVETFSKEIKDLKVQSDKHDEDLAELFQKVRQQGITRKPMPKATKQEYEDHREMMQQMIEVPRKGK